MSVSRQKAERLTQLAAQSAERRMEALKLYRPLPTQEPVFTSQARELLLRGGNRSGKSTTAGLFVASIATSEPVMTREGTPFPPLLANGDHPKTIWVIGYGEKHIGQTLYRILFRPGLFKIIKDRETGEFRSWRPWESWDKRHEHLTKPSPPAIPRRLIDPKGWSWKDKAKRHFEVCRLRNGTEIYAFTSIGEPKMGDPVDLIWIDERIRFPKHYGEWQARIADRRGRIVWSAWPGYSNTALYELHRRCTEERLRVEKSRAENPLSVDQPDAEEICLYFSTNPFIDEESKRKALKGWTDEKERLSRDRGDFIQSSTRIYPSFGPEIHNTPPDNSNLDDNVDLALRSNGMEPPSDWRLDLVIDPGHTHPGALLVAIPPPYLQSRCVGVVFDEFYIPGTDASVMARLLAPKLQGRSFESFIIDFRAGRMTPMGHSETIMQHYAAAFKKFNLHSAATGHHFRWSSDNLEGDIAATRELLHVSDSGRPYLRYIRSRCDNFERQMESYVKKEGTQGFVEDKPASSQVDCLCDCLRYWVGAKLSWRMPEPPKPPPSADYLYFRDVWKKEEEDATLKRDGSICLGAGEPTGP
jgi:hypothetical protein